MKGNADKSNPMIHRSCMRDQIRNMIVTRILDGSYPAGMRLKEMTLARDFNVSQAPVREALREMEALGLVESERFRGTRVRSVDAAELREAYELRALIEERSAQLAVPCAPGELDTLRSELRQMHRAARRRDVEGYAAGAVRFHRKIVELSGNRQFLRVWDSLHWEARTRIAAHRISADLPAFARAHDAILGALRMADGTRAGHLLRRLIEQFLARISRDGKKGLSAPGKARSAVKSSRPPR